MKLCIFLCAVILLSRLATAEGGSLPLTTPIRGVWIPSPDHTDFFTSKQTIEQHLGELTEAGINTVFVVMWNQGRTFYPSRVMKNLTGIEIDERFKDRDPLKEILTAAKPLNIKVFAWFEFGFATDVRNGKGKEIIEQKPHWVALNREGQPVIKNGFRWMNALHTEVQDFLLSLFIEVAENYDVAGIQGDDRLPALPSEAGYNPETIALYRESHQGHDPPSNHKDRQWVQWRADRLSQFMARLYGVIKKRRPTMIVAMAPSVFPWSRNEYLQDWPTWVKNGWVDVISPQLYRKDLKNYQAVLQAVMREQLNSAQRSIVFPGILLKLGSGYQASTELITQMIEANRREGVTGEIYFYHEGVRQQKTFFKSLYER